MSGNQLLGILYGADMEAFPTIGQIELNSDLYMNYLGRDTFVLTRNENKTTSYSRNFLRDATLLKYFPGLPIDNNDAALLLIDKDQIPTNLFATLGYEFTDDVWSSPNRYTISHPHNYPQRLSTNLQLLPPGWLEAPNSNHYNSDLPYAIATGSEGAPIITQPSLPTTEPGLATAILYHVPPDIEESFSCSILDQGPPRRSVGYRRFVYYSEIHATKMKVLESAIRQNCWRKRDSLAIATNKTYRTTELIDNSSATNPYNQDASISSCTVLTTPSSSLFSETTATLEITRLHAQTCTIGGFTLPATHPGESKPWQVTVAAKQIDINPNASTIFSYTPADNSTLELSTVVLNRGTASSTARQLNNQLAASDERTDVSSSFKVYPNPSPDGLFHINLPEGGPFSVIIYNMEGKEVYEAVCNDNPCTIQLPAISRGTYVLHVYNSQNSQLMDHQLIVY